MDMCEKFNKKTLFLLIALIIPAPGLLAQVYEENETLYKGRFFVSPDFGLQLGTLTRIELAPSLGYFPLERLAFGVGARYEFYQDNFTGASIPKTHIYGAKLFSRFVLIKNIDNIVPLNMFTSIFVHAENEILSLENRYFKWPSYPSEGRFLLNTVLAGAGFAQPTSENSSFTFMVLWDLSNNSLRSPYPNPLLRIGLQLMLN